MLLTILAVLAVQPRFADVTAPIGLGADAIPETVARLCLVDVDGDGLPDAVIDRHRVFLNRADASGPGGRRFVEVPADRTGLDVPAAGTAAVFADLDNDGRVDAVTAEFIDAHNPKWVDHGRRTRWQRGRGDGTFEEAVLLPVPARPTIAIAVGDVNRDGRLDLWFGNTYVQYGASVEAETNDLLLSDGAEGWRRACLPEDNNPFTPERDLGGRPTFGTLIASLSELPEPVLLELSYGRRWNRLWMRLPDGGWTDVAPALRFDGDDIRHGRHPEWLKERARTDPRFDREDEPPFRANGNTFDASIGDVDNDGRFDVLVTEITHAWAGESADRSRILLAAAPTSDRSAPGPGALAPLPYELLPAARLALDRVPAPDDLPAARSWNQGDLFGTLADLDNDGWLDVLLSSGDYPDDQRLRVYRGRPAPAPLVDATSALAIDHDGSQQISLGDIDGDGDLDVLVGQTFNRFTAEQREGRSPHPKLLLNEASMSNRALELRLEGDGRRVNRQGIGAIVRATLPDGTARIAQMVGPGGHAGKQNDAVIHIGLGSAPSVSAIDVSWPGDAPPTVIEGPVAPGRYVVRMDGTLVDLNRAGSPEPEQP
ncbi:MAG: CRTAC1 family protein [Phycisphaerales bacterium]|nr:CRTAC1 family protein [Phycisphaerales bacterium]